KDKAPWSRGDADWSAVGGGLGVRDPYIPDLLTGRVGSWCNKADFICTGNPKDIHSTVNNQSHEKYDDIWIPQAANEIATFLQGDIKHYAADIKKIDWIPQYGTSLNHDVMIVIDTTGSMGT